MINDNAEQRDLTDRSTNSCIMKDDLTTLQCNFPFYSKSNLYCLRMRILKWILTLLNIQKDHNKG